MIISGDIIAIKTVNEQDDKKNQDYPKETDEMYEEDMKFQLNPA
jgi:hypothetical protein